MTAGELIEQIRKQAASMSDEERRKIAVELIAAGEDLIDDDDPWLSPEYQTELARRVENVRSGRSVGRPADEVMAEIRARFAR